MLRRWAFLLVLTVLAGPIGTASADNQLQSTRAKPAGLFGSIEFRGGPLEPSRHWQDVLQRMEREQRTLGTCLADESACGTAALRTWRQHLLTAASQGRRDMVGQVNRFFNQWPYRSDAETYRAEEHWASPVEFMDRSGDCEDYAIAKFFALRLLGVENRDLRIVTLINRATGGAHAVLAVHSGGETLILDSKSDAVLPDTAYRHYAPLVSVNETTRWAHITIRPADGPRG